jgi:nucleotide-binding universal stress UspA family protein
MSALVAAQIILFGLPQKGRYMRHIIVATDGSSCADHAVDFAAALAKATGATLLVMTVGGDHSAEDVRKLARTEGSTPEALELLTNQILQQASERATRVGPPRIRVQTGWGDAAETIIETARHEHSDAIVVGRRGRGRLAGLLLGSVSQKLVTLAPCAVIVVP